MLIEAYFAEIERSISSCPFVHTYNIVKDKRSLYIGLVEGVVKFMDNSTLHFTEFIDVSKGIEKFKYSYHYEDAHKEMIFRYDMAPHFKNIKTHPHHKHEKDKVIESAEPTLMSILNEIEKIFVV